MKKYYELNVVNNNVSDIYKALTVHIMLGTTYREDKEFLHSILFSDDDIKTWYYLKLSAFEFVKEEADDGIQNFIIRADLPAGYKSVNLESVRNRIRQAKLDKSLTSTPINALNHAKTTFYSGDFTGCLL